MYTAYIYIYIYMYIYIYRNMHIHQMHPSKRHHQPINPSTYSPAEKHAGHGTDCL